MGAQKYLRKIENLFEKSPVVDFQSIQRSIGKSETSNYAKLLVSNLLKKGRIKKIGKGVYTKHNEISLAVFSFKPAYLGLQSALSHYNLWEQETIPVIVTARKVRRGIRSLIGGNILIKNINKKYFFGFEYVKEGDFYLPYSDLEKTFIDFIVFNQKIDNAVLIKFRKKIKKDKLLTYLKKYPDKFRKLALSALKK